MTARVYDVGQGYQSYTTHSTQAGFPIRLTATGQVLAVPGMLIGFYVNATTAGTLILYDALTATNPISGTITPAVGMQWFPSIHLTGIFATIGGTLDATFFYLK
jgi:hypothetical protein